MHYVNVSYCLEKNEIKLVVEREHKCKPMSKAASKKYLCALKRILNAHHLHSEYMLAKYNGMHFLFSIANRLEQNAKRIVLKSLFYISMN